MSKAVNAAARKIFIGGSSVAPRSRVLRQHTRATERRYTIAAMSAPSPRDRCIAQRERSKVIRFAGFRRLHPIVPDRAAFGAAVEDETHRDNTENNRQSPAHGLPRAPAPIIRGQSGRFQATLAEAENASRPSGPEFRDGRHLIAPETLPIVA